MAEKAIDGGGIAGMKNSPAVDARNAGMEPPLGVVIPMPTNPDWGEETEEYAAATKLGSTNGDVPVATTGDDGGGGRTVNGEGTGEL